MRERKEIEEEVKDLRKIDYQKSLREIQIEVLLDIRDLLKETKGKLSYTHEEVFDIVEKEQRRRGL